MIRMNLTNNFLLILISIIFFSCDKKGVFDQYHSLGKTWNKDTIVAFNFNRTDTTTVYNLFVNLRNNNDYPFSNLFLIVSLEEPDGLTKVDTLEYQMANPDGTLLGTGFSDFKESKLWYKENIKFLKTGDYKLSIQQAVRKTGKISGVQELEGITEVGFRIESTE